MTWEGDVGYTVKKEVNRLYACIAYPCLGERVQSSAFCAVHEKKYRPIVKKFIKEHWKAK